ncbi:hypothetical protein Y023_5133 [Burkholderia pseudomallei A79D]|nr:hypothetical protein Y023_5133 [Burkholderia pseudomallei A79D]KGX97322.1 hypothetical protein X997_4816 [Burkholderia pseudomallei A79C]
MRVNRQRRGLDLVGQDVCAGLAAQASIDVENLGSAPPITFLGPTGKATWAELRTQTRWK